MIDLISGVCKQTRDVTMLHRVTFVKIGLRGICRGGRPKRDVTFTIKYIREIRVIRASK